MGIYKRGEVYWYKFIGQGPYGAGVHEAGK